MVVTALFFLIPAIAIALENSPPVAEAGSEQTIYLGDSVQLYGSATDPDGDLIVDWEWKVIAAPVGSTYSLADANTSIALFTTDKVGKYIITLRARDYFDWSDLDAVLVSVVENQPSVVENQPSVANIAHFFDLSFAWDANTEPDLAGYRIYYNNGDSVFPYNGTGAIEGNSLIEIPLAILNDPANPEYTLHGFSDAETYYFAATAYDIYGNESDYSNILCFGSDCVEGDGGCFIATAAFGSKFEKQVKLLRRFRDIYLIPHTIGRVFVRAYYRYSPPIADFIAKHDSLRTVVRVSLLPVVGACWVALKVYPLSPMALMLFFGFCFIGLVWFRRNYKR